MAHPNNDRIITVNDTKKFAIFVQLLKKKKHLNLI